MKNESYADARDMFAVHTMFRREFALMPALVRRAKPADKQRAEIVADHIELVNGVLHHHHRLEDKHLWQKLLERVPETAHSIVRVMERHHQALEQIIVESDVATRIWRASATSGAAEALADALDRLSALVTEHMALEEQQILPLAEKHITAAEWGHMVQEGASGIPQEQIPLIFGMIMYEGEPDVIQQILFSMPPEVRPVMKQQSRQAFMTHSQRVHGTPTPARSNA